LSGVSLLALAFALTFLIFERTAYWLLVASTSVSVLVTAVFGSVNGVFESNASSFDKVGCTIKHLPIDKGGN